MESIPLLLVDDDVDLLALLSATLRAVDVATATSGEEALELLRRIEPEMIVSDVLLPGLTGFELCHRIHAMGLTKIPFTFLSTVGSPHARREGLRRGPPCARSASSRWVTGRRPTQARAHRWHLEGAEAREADGGLDAERPDPAGS